MRSFPILLAVVAAAALIGSLGCVTTSEEDFGPSTAAVLAEYGVVDCDALRAAVINQGKRVALEEKAAKLQKIGAGYADGLGSPGGVVGTIGATPIDSAPEREEMELLLSAARLQNCSWAPVLPQVSASMCSIPTSKPAICATSGCSGGISEQPGLQTTSPPKQFGEFYDSHHCGSPDFHLG